MKLSKRLLTIASLIPKKKRVIDVGCDHGLLGIYLYKFNHNKVILSDIKDSCIKKSLENISKYDTLDILTVKSDGLKEITVKKNDILIIAGMGTHTILNILNDSKVSLINQMVIQTNNNYETLRKEIVKKGFYISDEVFLIEKEIPYIIINFKRGATKYSKLDYTLGPILKNDSNYKKHMKQKLSSIYGKIPNNKIFKKLKLKLLLKKLQ